jgi:hypothetical protein
MPVPLCGLLPWVKRKQKPRPKPGLNLEVKPKAPIPAAVGGQGQAGHLSRKCVASHQLIFVQAGNRCGLKTSAQHLHVPDLSVEIPGHDG